MPKLPAIAVHGRFQPPMHINHWNYVREAFERANHVTILITNPYPTGSERNPFTFDERAYMFKRLLNNVGYCGYDIRPFNITSPTSFAALDRTVPYLINVYDTWSIKKVIKFIDHGLTVIRLDQPKVWPVSGVDVRRAIQEHGADQTELTRALVKLWFLSEALPGLHEVLRQRQRG